MEGKAAGGHLFTNRDHYPMAGADRQSFSHSNRLVVSLNLRSIYVHALTYIDLTD